MSDEKTANTKADAPGAAPTLSSIPRTFETIQAEYMKVVQELGNLTWQIEILKNQKQGLYGKLNDLGTEAAALPKPAPAAPAKKPALVPAPPKAGGDGT